MEDQDRLSWQARVALAVLAGAACLLLATARWLEPDPRGSGTHEQLGLAGCQFARWTGLPCPTCGATTAWSHAVRGEMRAAAAANLGGALTCLAAAAAAPWLIVSAAVGRWWIVRPKGRWVLWAGSLLLAAMLLDWARRLAAG